MDDETVDPTYHFNLSFTSFWENLLQRFYDRKYNASYSCSGRL